MDRRSLSDENIEDILRQHLQAEVEAIPPATNPWERMRGRLPRQRKKFLGLFDLSLGSAARPALAAVAVLVLVIGVTTWQSFENFGARSPSIAQWRRRILGAAGRGSDDAINYDGPPKSFAVPMQKVPSSLSSKITTPKEWPVRGST